MVVTRLVKVVVPWYIVKVIAVLLEATGVIVKMRRVVVGRVAAPTDVDAPDADQSARLIATMIVAAMVVSAVVVASVILAAVLLRSIILSAMRPVSRSGGGHSESHRD